MNRVFKVLLGLLGSSLVLAHGSLVLGAFTVSPQPPQANQPFTITLKLTDPNQVPIENAVVHAEFRASGDNPLFTPFTTHFGEKNPGFYEGSITLPKDEAWQVLIRDQTYRQEEAKAVVNIQLGAGGTTEPLSFQFPPTVSNAAFNTSWIFISLILSIPIIVVLIISLRIRLSHAEAQAKS